MDTNDFSKFICPCPQFSFLELGEFLQEIVCGNIPIDRWSDPTYLYPGLSAMYGDAIERGINYINQFLARRALRTKIITVALDREMTDQQKYEIARILMRNNLIPAESKSCRTAETFSPGKTCGIFLTRKDLTCMKNSFYAAEVVFLSGEMDQYIQLSSIFERKSGPDYMQDIGEEGILNPFYYGGMKTLVIFINRKMLLINEDGPLSCNKSLTDLFHGRAYSLLTVAPASSGNAFSIYQCLMQNIPENRFDRPFKEMPLPFDQVVALKKIVLGSEK